MKKKRKITKALTKASKRNWTKFRITGMIKSCEGFRKDKTLSMTEEFKVLKCQRILETMITDWKPTL